jgi:phenylpropionate dioxygenase-like ring-hydroxylating dioxygenase large terminal subunit
LIFFKGACPLFDFSCKDPVALNLWHVIASCEELEEGNIICTRLLGDQVAFARDPSGEIAVWRYEHGTIPTLPEMADRLPVREKYNYIWTTFGTPTADIFGITEFDEADRRNIHAASIGVKVSAPRAIENFLDMGHFPYIHTNILGVEPHTEVKEYFVDVSEERDEIIATDCKFWQPMASAASSEGAEVDYIYRVPHPYCSVLYKSSPEDEKRLDAIAVFIQPIDEENVRAHMLLSLIDTINEDTAIRLFQQTIFGQDKPILENQYPKRLPLDPRAETPIRADKSAIAYRRWLTRKGLTYGVIPAAA